MLQLAKPSKLLVNVPKLMMLSASNLLHTSQIFHKRRKSCGLPKVAVILCGCGALDGTEISEAISLAIHLSKKGFKPKFFAPDVDICATVNHLTKDPDDCGPPRNALIEGARLARAQVQPLCVCSSCDNEALVLPGGWGAARTLSDFAAKGKDCIIHPDLERIIKEFHCASKPIGSICIASAIIAKVIPGAKITLGKDCPKDQWPFHAAIEKVKQMGANVEMTDVKGVTHCPEHDVYSTPAWLDTKASYADIHAGIGKMVEMMAKTIK